MDYLAESIIASTNVKIYPPDELHPHNTVRSQIKKFLLEASNDLNPFIEYFIEQNNIPAKNGFYTALCSGLKRNQDLIDFIINTSIHQYC